METIDTKTLPAFMSGETFITHGDVLMWTIFDNIDLTKLVKIEKKGANHVLAHGAHDNGAHILDGDCDLYELPNLAKQYVPTIWEDLLLTVVNNTTTVRHEGDNHYNYIIYPGLIAVSRQKVPDGEDVAVVAD